MNGNDTPKTEADGSAERNVRPLCSHCRFPLPSNTSGLRHYGLHTAHQESECLQLLRAEIERLREVLTRLQQWADAYPLDQFPEVLRQEWQQANEVLAQAGLSMSRMSASNMRHVLNGARKMLAEGLGPN